MTFKIGDYVGYFPVMACLGELEFLSGCSSTDEIADIKGEYIYMKGGDIIHVDDEIFIVEDDRRLDLIDYIFNLK